MAILLHLKVAVPMKPKVSRLPASPIQQAPVLKKALFRSAEFLGIERDELAEILGTTPSTLSRYANGEGMFQHKSKQWELSTFVIRVARGLSAQWGGNAENCQKWLRAELYPMGRPPIDAMKNLEGMVDVLRYLDAMRGKI